MILEGIPPMEVVRLGLHLDDLLLLSPRDISLTPNQAREVQSYLRGELPEYRLIVIPFPVDVAALGAADLEHILKEEV